MYSSILILLFQSSVIVSVVSIVCCCVLYIDYTQQCCIFVYFHQPPQTSHVVIDRSMGVKLSPTSAWEDVEPWRDEESGGGARYHLKAWRLRQPLHPLDDTTVLNHKNTMKIPCDTAVHGTPGSASMDQCGKSTDSTQVCEGCACSLTGVGRGWVPPGVGVMSHLFVFFWLCGGISKLGVLGRV